MTEKREQPLARTEEIVIADPTDDSPNSVVIDTALTHLIKSEQSLDDAVELMNPATVYQVNTSVLAVEYQNSVESSRR